MCLFGLDHELLNGLRSADQVDWTPFISGCFAGAVPWAIIFAYLGSSPSLSLVPAFVWVILVVYLVAFNVGAAVGMDRVHPEPYQVSLDAW